MSLLRTRAIRVGTMIAFTADPTAMNGVSLMMANMSLSRGDVVQVLSIEVGNGTTWAKVQVLVVRGKTAGRTGYVCIDMGERLQRCWQALTPTGSMAPVRVTAKASTNPPKMATPPESGVRDTQIMDDNCSFSFDILKEQTG